MGGWWVVVGQRLCQTGPCWLMQMNTSTIGTVDRDACHGGFGIGVLSGVYDGLEFAIDTFDQRTVSVGARLGGRGCRSRWGGWWR